MNIVIEIDGVRHKLVRSKKNVCIRCSLYDICQKWERGCHAWALSGSGDYRFKLEK